MVQVSDIGVSTVIERLLMLRLGVRVIAGWGVSYGSCR